MTVTKQFRFEAAHQLNDYGGPCANLHGHSYLLEVSITGTSLTDGMLMDFTALKALVQPLVDMLDHNYLNIIFTVPTAEVMVLWFGRMLRAENSNICRIKLWETTTSYAEIEYEVENDDLKDQ
jgi:6-pyruvoyltetrahydropterin/6-carboxytetrahydropterin synthase